MSCRTGPLRVGRAFARLFNLSWRGKCGGASRCSGMMFVMTNGSPVADDGATTGIHATK
jgi:hypothetical protein